MIAVEKKGRPTVSYTAAHFVNDARANADLLGIASLPLAVMEGEFTNQPYDRIRRMVSETVDQVVQGLTQQPKGEGRQKHKPAERESIQGDDLLECTAEFNRLFIERGWSDGLPLVPPTPRAVERLLAHTSLSPDTVVVNGLYPGLGVATVEKLAINGVMAGCRPEQMPVLIALARAYEGTGILGKTAAISTGPNAPLVLISGPIVQKLGFNNSTCVAGPASASHVNIAVGRALRLILMNVGQAYPGTMDMDTIGTPNKFSFCLAENAARSPWDPWNVEKGFDKDTSTLTICLVYPGPDLHNFTAVNPEELLSSVTSLTGSFIATASIGRWLYGGRQDPVTKEILLEKHVLLLAPAHADLMRNEGWSKDNIRDYLHRYSRIPFHRLHSDALRPLGPALKAAHPELMWLLDQPDTLIPISPGPECFEVFVTGGEAGRSQFLYGGSEASTVAIEV